MGVFTVLAWVAGVYCLGGLLAVLLVVLAARGDAAPDAAGPPGRVLRMVFAAWPVVLAMTATMGLHRTLQYFRVPRP